MRLFDRFGSWAPEKNGNWGVAYLTSGLAGEMLEFQNWQLHTEKFMISRIHMTWD